MSNNFATLVILALKMLASSTVNKENVNEL